MEDINLETQMAKINSYGKGFFAYHLINIASKLGILEILNDAKDGVTVPDLASKLGLHEPYLKILCQTAYSYEIFDCDSQGRFKFQPFMDEILGDKSNPRTLLPANNLFVNFAGKELYEFPEYISGGVINDSYTPEISEAVFQATKSTHLAFLYLVILKNDQLKKMLEQGIKLLEIGCGSGNLIVQLAQTFANSRFVGVDPEVDGIERAKNKISQLSLDKRVSLECMGAQELPYEDEFDLVSMVLCFHAIPPEVRGPTAEKAYEALKNKGQLLLFDPMYPGKLEDFRNPMYDFGIQDQFIETCMGVVHLNMNEKNGLLTKAGFKNIQRTVIIPGIFDLVTATK